MRNTGDFEPLLDALNEEELGQYGDMALDQVRREARWAWLQVVLILGAIGLVSWGVWNTARRGIDWSLVYAVLGGAALVYWPWRSAKVKKLWRRHHATVTREIARRRAGHQS